MSQGGERGLSPVVGVALLVVIVVLLSVTTAAMLLGATGSLEQPAPVVASNSHVTLGIDNGTIESQNLTLVHEGGEAVPTDRLRVVVDTGNGTVSYRPAGVDDDRWTAGERLHVPLNESAVCTGGSSVDVSMVYRGRQSSTVVGERTIPVTEGGFVIEDGAVVPASGYDAKVTVVGTGFTYGGGPRIDIRMTVGIDNRTYTPWPGNVNNNGNPRSATFSNRDAGTEIEVAATGDPHSTYISPRTRWSNASNGWVYVLRDGDTPPNLQGYGGQASASATLQQYLDGGELDLAENQAIYLFELGNSQSGSAADYQDVVVLVSLQTSETTASVRSVDGENVVVCPASN